MIKIETKIFLLVNVFFVILLSFFENMIYSSFITQIYIFIIPLLWPGLAHGSIDILTAKRKNIISSDKNNLIFLISYVIIPVFFFLIWLNFPNFTFTVFLVLSLLHFGISDKLYFNKLISLIEISLRALIVFTLPIVFHNYETIQIVRFLYVSDEYLLTLTKFFEYLVYFIIPLMALFIYYSFIKQNVGGILEIFIILFCFYFFKPLVSFLLYFCFLHSTRHLLNEKKLLNLSFKKIFFKTIPMTSIVVVGTFILLFLSYFFFKSSSLLFSSYIIIALFCFTIPHIILINFTKN